jgi:hypothetical protein
VLAIKLINPIDGNTQQNIGLFSPPRNEGDKGNKTSFLDIFNQKPNSNKDGDELDSNLFNKELDAKHEGDKSTTQQIDENHRQLPFISTKEVASRAVIEAKPDPRARTLDRNLLGKDTKNSTFAGEELPKVMDESLTKPNLGSDKKADSKQTATDPITPSASKKKEIKDGSVVNTKSSEPSLEPVKDQNARSIGENRMPTSFTSIAPAKVIETSYKGITTQLALQIENFSTSSLNSQQLTIKIRPSNLGEIVIVLNKTQPQNTIADKTTMAPIDIKMIASNPEVANYLGVVKRELGLRNGVRNVNVSTNQFVDKAENSKRISSENPKKELDKISTLELVNRLI